MFFYKIDLIGLLKGLISMSYLVRRITASFWPDGQNSVLDNIDKLNADAITNDLSTKGNMLSLWEIEDLHQMEDVALAIATTRNEKKDFLIVAIPKDDIQADLEIEKDDLGDTAYTKYKSCHYDLLNMNLFDLKIFAMKVIDTLKNHSFTYDFIFNENTPKLRELYKLGELDEAFLKQKSNLYKIICKANN